MKRRGSRFSQAARPLNARSLQFYLLGRSPPFGTGRHRRNPFGAGCTTAAPHAPRLNGRRAKWEPRNRQNRYGLDSTLAAAAGFKAGFSR